MKKNSKETLELIRKNLLEYLNQKVLQEDFHGVADAAMDLREIDAKLEILHEMKSIDLLKSDDPIIRAINND